MKNDCNIVRDLMPLVIDGVASDESREMVTEHVWQCEECSKVYSEYQKNLPERIPKEELDVAAKALRKWHRARRMLLVGLTVLVTVVVFAVGSYAWDMLAWRTLKTLPLDDYDTCIVRMQDGAVQVFAQPDDKGLYIGSVGRGNGHEMQYEVKTSVIARYGYKAMCINEYVLINDELWSDRTPMAYEITSIAFVDGKETRIVYTEGDEIPFASPELEALDELISSFYAGGKGNGLTDEQQAAYDAQYALVPEFQIE